jgi:hypothetical protein
MHINERLTQSELFTHIYLEGKRLDPETRAATILSQIESQKEFSEAHG